jgi:ribulose-phosphate 3-epimerase
MKYSPSFPLQESSNVERPPEYRTLFIGADHAGIEAANLLISHFRDRGFRVIDCTNNITEKDDYPDRALELYRAMRSERLLGEGILLCASGEGMCMAANAFSGIRAAEAGNIDEAKLSREHNGANILCLGAREHSPETLIAISEAFFDTPFSDEKRHIRRREKLSHLHFVASVFTKKDRRFRGNSPVIPAILEKTISQIERKLTLLIGCTDRVQIDILDGTFSKGTTPLPDAIDAASYPFFFDAHLMVSNPMKYIDSCARAGYSRVFFHHEVVEYSETIIEAIHRSGMEAGIAISPNTPLSFIDPLLLKIDAVLLIGVAPGKSGQMMFPEFPKRVSAMKSRIARSTPLLVDGGVNAQTASELVEAGATHLCSASAIFSGAKTTERIAERITALENVFFD